MIVKQEFIKLVKIRVPLALVGIDGKPDHIYANEVRRALAQVAFDFHETTRDRGWLALGKWAQTFPEKKSTRNANA